LKVGQLGEQTGKGVNRSADESFKSFVLIATRLFRDPISAAEAVDRLNAVELFDCVDMRGAGISVYFDQVEMGSVETAFDFALILVL
jgi:hypothetical protein